MLTDRFDQDSPDAEWLPIVGKQGCVVLTKDTQIRKNQVEIVKLLESGAPCFILTSAEMTGAQMALAFCTALPDIRRFLRKFSPPYVATVTPAGKVSMLLTQAELIKRIE